MGIMDGIKNISKAREVASKVQSMINQINIEVNQGKHDWAITLQGNPNEISKIVVGSSFFDSDDKSEAETRLKDAFNKYMKDSEAAKQKTLMSNMSAMQGMFGE